MTCPNYEQFSGWRHHIFNMLMLFFSFFLNECILGLHSEQNHKYNLKSCSRRQDVMGARVWWGGRSRTRACQCWVNERTFPRGESGKTRQASQVLTCLTSHSPKNLSKGNEQRCQDTCTGCSLQNYLEYDNLNTAIHSQTRGNKLINGSTSIWYMSCSHECMLEGLNSMKTCLC